MVRRISSTRLQMLTSIARLVRAQDLGQGESDEFVDEEQAGEKATLIRTQTQASTGGHDTQKSARAGPNFGLIKCIWILLSEQGNLWKHFLVLSIATLAGGKRKDSCKETRLLLTTEGSTYPAQAILFSRVVEAFQLPSARAVHQGDFYSLMFFVVALGNLAVYAVVGYTSNIVAQVGHSAIRKCQ